MGFSLKDYEEPSVSTWFLMSSPYPILTIVALYLWFCLKAGPHFMRNREPFELTGFIKWYNLFQVVVNTYIAIRIILEIVPYVNYICEPVPDASTPFGRLQIFGTHAVFLLKLLEFTDTGLFVLRKKYNQISLLHLYHHSAVALMGWMCTKYFPGGNVWFFGLLNITVHVVMYAYYFIAALGPKYRKYLWWKKYITVLQMVQFVLVFSHSFRGLFADCRYPKAVMILTCTQSVIFFAMFAQFYINTYIYPKKSQGASKSHNSVDNVHT